MSIMASGPVKDHDPEVTRDSMRSYGPTWFGSEAMWFASTFAKAFLSVAFLGVLGKLFESNWASGDAYDRAADLAFGRRPKPWRETFGSSSRVWGSSQSSQSSANAGWQPRSTDPGPQPNPNSAPPPFSSNTGMKANFVREVGGIPLWHHAEQVREDHLWKGCPINNHKEGCDTCDFLVIDKNQTAYCAANEKLKQILAGRDDGSDLYEIVRQLKAR